MRIKAIEHILKALKALEGLTETRETEQARVSLMQAAFWLDYKVEGAKWLDPKSWQNNEPFELLGCAECDAPAGTPCRSHCTAIA